MKKTLIYLILLFFILIIFELLNGFWFRSPLEKNLLNLNALYDIDIQINPNDYYQNNQNISYSRNKCKCLKVIFTQNNKSPNKQITEKILPFV